MTTRVVTVTVAPLEDAPTARESQRLTALHVVTSLLGEGVTVGHRPDGAPFLEGPATAGIQLSVSHGAGCLAVAMSRDSAVGIDIEARTPRVAKVVPRVASGVELQLDPLVVWTVKEAVFKAAGIPGLTLGEIAVAPDGGATARGRLFRWYMVELDRRRAVALALPVL